VVEQEEEKQERKEGGEREAQENDDTNDAPTKPKQKAPNDRTKGKGQKQGAWSFKSLLSGFPFEKNLTSLVVSGSLSCLGLLATGWATNSLPLGPCPPLSIPWTRKHFATLVDKATSEPRKISLKPELQTWQGAVPLLGDGKVGLSSESLESSGSSSAYFRLDPERGEIEIQQPGTYRLFYICTLAPTDTEGPKDYICAAIILAGQPLPFSYSVHETVSSIPLRDECIETLNEGDKVCFVAKSTYAEVDVQRSAFICGIELFN
jgi:hypothetical protein